MNIIQVNTSGVGQNFFLDNVFFIEPVQITIGGTGVSQNQPANPLAESGGLFQYMLNQIFWRSGSPLQPLGNFFYHAAITGSFLPGDQLLTGYQSVAGSFVPGPCYSFAANPNTNFPSVESIANAVYSLIQTSGLTPLTLQVKGVNFGLSL